MSTSFFLFQKTKTIVCDQTVLPYLLIVQNLIIVINTIVRQIKMATMALINVLRNRAASSKGESRASLGPVVVSSRSTSSPSFLLAKHKMSVFFAPYKFQRVLVHPGEQGYQVHFPCWNDYKKFYKGVNGEQTPFFTDSLSLGSRGCQKSEFLGGMDTEITRLLKSVKSCYLFTSQPVLWGKKSAITVFTWSYNFYSWIMSRSWHVEWWMMENIVEGKKSMYRASFHYVFVRILHVSCNLSCSFPAYDTCDHTLSSVFTVVKSHPKCLK